MYTPRIKVIRHRTAFMRNKSVNFINSLNAIWALAHAKAGREIFSNWKLGMKVYRDLAMFGNG